VTAEKAKSTAVLFPFVAVAVAVAASAHAAADIAVSIVPKANGRIVLPHCVAVAVVVDDDGDHYLAANNPPPFSPLLVNEKWLTAASLTNAVMKSTRTPSFSIFFPLNFYSSYAESCLFLDPLTICFLLFSRRFSYIALFYCLLVALVFVASSHSTREFVICHVRILCVFYTVAFVLIKLADLYWSRYRASGHRAK